MDPQTLQSAFAPVAADYVKRLDLRVTAVRPGEVDVTMPVAYELVNGGASLRAAIMARSTAMVMAMIADLAIQPMTTVLLQTSFLRPVPADTAEVQ